MNFFVTSSVLAVTAMLAAPAAAQPVSDASSPAETQQSEPVDATEIVVQA